MDRETRRKIINDYKIVEDNILRILEGGPNFYVGSEHYITPKVTISTAVPFDDPKGELNYFMTLRDCLESALTQEKIFLRIPNAPDYIEKFF